MTDVAIIAWHLPSGGLLKAIEREHAALDRIPFSSVVLFGETAGTAYQTDLIDGLRARKVVWARLLCRFRPSVFLNGRAGEEIRGSGMDIPVLLAIPLFFEATRAKPRVLVCHELATAILCAPWSKLCNRPIVTVLHDDPFSFLRGDSRKGRLGMRIVQRTILRIARRVLFSSKLVVATSSTIAESLRDNYAGTNITSIEYGTEPHESCREYALRRTVLSVANWTKSRRVNVYFELARLLPPRTPLVIAGHFEDFPTPGPTTRVTGTDGPGGEVSLERDVSEDRLTALYDDALVFVRLGYGERGTGQGVVEAIGHGCPVVVGGELGSSRLVLPGVHGFIVDSHDIESVASSITQILGDPELARRMSDNCRRLALEKPWTEYEQSFADLVRLIVKGGTAHHR